MLPLYTGLSLETNDNFQELCNKFSDGILSRNPREVTLFGFPSPKQQEVTVDWSKASTSLPPLIEAGLSTETGQEQDEWMSALAHHAATDVYESTDDYDQIQFVRDANQHHWLQDCKTLAMTQMDLNYLTTWVDDVKAAHTIRNNNGDFEDTPTQLNL